LLKEKIYIIKNKCIKGYIFDSENLLKNNNDENEYSD
jgi:hypothetical protein